MPESVARYRETLDHLLEGFQIIDREYRYLYLNPAAAAHGRSTPEALTDRTMLEAYPGIEDSPLFRVLSRCFATGEGERLENLFEFADGTKRWFELRVEPVPEGLCVYSYDIDQRKRAEDTLRETNLELERRVAERTKALSEANRELEAFSYSVAHDLRAPLRSIDGFSRLLLEDCGDQLDDVGRAHVARVRSAASRMGALIDDLLTLSRVTLTDVDRVHVDLSRMARAVAHGLDERDPTRHTVWDIEEGVGAHCDPALARIVLENVLGNAWKFTGRAASPRVRLRAGSGTEVVVEDNGVGFDMAHADRLFVPFRRLHGEGEFAGTGIGLATVARIVGKHGGTLRAEGVVGEGATVTFDLGK